MIQIDYAIAIRTLGTAGEKYQKLLNSIEKLNVKPQKIVVVLPEGYELPKEQLGYEMFVYSPKSMIMQRINALQYIENTFTLFCDDDVELEPDFVEKVAKPLLHGEYACSSGPLLEFFPPKSLKYYFASLLGGACVMIFRKKQYYVKILKTGGWSYNRDILCSEERIYQTDSLPWTCFFINTEVMRSIHFEDELWAEKVNYAAFEDRVMFYKLKRNGYKTCVVSNAKYFHNDAKTSTSWLRLEQFYARAYNHYIFWHRYIFMEEHGISKILAKLAIGYYVATQKVYYKLKFKKNQIGLEVYRAYVKGFSDAKVFIKSEEYRKLSSIYCTGENQ